MKAEVHFDFEIPEAQTSGLSDLAAVDQFQKEIKTKLDLLFTGHAFGQLLDNAGLKDIQFGSAAVLIKAPVFYVLSEKTIQYSYCIPAVSPAQAKEIWDKSPRLSAESEEFLKGEEFLRVVAEDGTEYEQEDLEQ